MRVRHLLLVSLVVSLVACSSESTATVTATLTPTSAPTPTLPTASAPAPTPPQAPVVTTAAPHVWVFGDEWEYSGADGAQGSGCSPGSAALPDGVWFGFADSWSIRSVGLDLACWYSGAMADSVAAARGDEVNNGFYLVNEAATLRSMPVDGDVPAKKAGGEDGVVTLSAVMGDLAGSLPTNHPYPVWIYVNGGVVTAVAVQFIP